MSGAKTAARRAGKKCIEPEIEARLADFDEYKAKLLDPLHKAHRRGPKVRPFDADRAWQTLRFIAFVYFQREREVGKNLAMVTAGDRVKLLTRLGDALRAARSAADEVMKTAKGKWFVEWAIAYGNPDFTDGRIDIYQDEFERRIASLKGLEEAAYQAAGAVRMKSGRPPGTTSLPHDLILNLESAYRNITETKAGAGPGPFASFVGDFLTASGRTFPEQTVIEAIKDTKRREEKHPAASRWGRDLFDGLGGKPSPVRTNSSS